MFGVYRTFINIISTTGAETSNISCDKHTPNKKQNRRYFQSSPRLFCVLFFIVFVLITFLSQSLGFFFCLHCRLREPHTRQRARSQTESPAKTKNYCAETRATHRGKRDTLTTYYMNAGALNERQSNMCPYTWSDDAQLSLAYEWLEHNRLVFWFVVVVVVCVAFAATCVVQCCASGFLGRARAS